VRFSDRLALAKVQAAASPVPGCSPPQALSPAATGSDRNACREVPFPFSASGAASRCPGQPGSGRSRSGVGSDVTRLCGKASWSLPTHAVFRWRRPIQSASSGARRSSGHASPFFRAGDVPLPDRLIHAAPSGWRAHRCSTAIADGALGVHSPFAGLILELQVAGRFRPTAPTCRFTERPPRLFSVEGSAVGLHTLPLPFEHPLFLGGRSRTFSFGFWALAPQLSPCRPALLAPERPILPWDSMPRQPAGGCEHSRPRPARCSNIASGFHRSAKSSI